MSTSAAPGSRMAQAMASAAAASDAASSKPKSATSATAKSTTSGSGGGDANSRPIHPAFLTSFGPGKGSGSSELSAWAYLTRPRPRRRRRRGGGEGGGRNDDADAPLPNLVTAQSNSLRVYTLLPHAGTLALTAVYDNLAGTICSLDVVPDGTSSSPSDDDGDGGAARYDGLLLGFAGHPRLSLVYPSAPMVDGSSSAAGGAAGQGGVLLASSIVDLTPALIERSAGGTSCLEQDVVVAVSSTARAGGEDGGYDDCNDGDDDDDDDDDPCVSVVLGGGVAVASFSLPRGPRPDEAPGGAAGRGTGGWWRVASEPYVLPLSALSTKVRDLGGNGAGSSSAAAAAASAAPGRRNPHGTGNPSSSAHASSAAQLLGTSHGFGDVLDAAYLAGYTEPTLVVLHSNPRNRGGGRCWNGRLGRTAEMPCGGSSPDEEEDEDDMDMDEDEYGEDGQIIEKKKRRAAVPMASTGTRYGLTLTAVSLSIHHRRSVVLWSLNDTMPADSWKLVPNPHGRDGGVLVCGVNTLVYVSMGGKVRCALAANGFAKIGCPSALMPPPPSSSGGGGRGGRIDPPGGGAHLEANPSPLPKLALQLDGARVSFVRDGVALVALTNGTLHLLELHRGAGDGGRMCMSLVPLGHRVGGLAVASCLSVFTGRSRSVVRYLGEEGVGGKEGGSDELDAISSDAVAEKQRPSGRDGDKVATRGLVFIGSRMGDCTLLAFSMKGPKRLAGTAAENDDPDGAGTNKRRRPEDKVKPDASGSLSQPGDDIGANDEPKRKLAKLEDDGEVEVLDGENGGGATTATSLTMEEILRLEEEELYRDDSDDEGAATAVSPSIVSSREDSDAAASNDEEDSYGDALAPLGRSSVQQLSTIHSLRALDSLTGLGPLGPGVYGPVATCPTLTASGQGDDDAAGADADVAAQQASIFSNAFASAARHYIMPCGYGPSGGLAVLTTPGRDNVGGSIVCEEDLCNMSGSIFGLRHSNLVLLGKAAGAGGEVGEGCIVLRGVVRDEDQVEEFDEVDICPSSGADDSMEVDNDGKSLSLQSVADVLGKTTILAATELYSYSRAFSVFVVQDPRAEVNDPYHIVIMTNNDVVSKGEDTKDDKQGIGRLAVHTVHQIASKDARKGSLASITPMVSKLQDDGSHISSITCGCTWSSGNASVFNIMVSGRSDEGSASEIHFEISESSFLGDENDDSTEDADFYDSNRISGMDVISLPSHIFDSPSTKEEKPSLTVASSSAAAVPDPATSLSFPPDRLSMHGTWCAKLESVDSGGDPSLAMAPTLAQNKILIAICRRSGLLQIYDNDDVLGSPLIEYSSPTSTAVLPIWEASGCSHGTAILGQSSSPSGGVNIRRPAHHDVEAAEIRLFVAGPSLAAGFSDGMIDAENMDSWMLRSLCILVDTSLGDLHLYSGSKRRSNGNRLEFARVPLSNVSRPSEESGRHLIKLRRKGIVPASSTAAAFRQNRLHRFHNVSSQDGLFAATPRPLWFVSERGAPTVVSHKSRHVSPAGGRPVPVSGFCTSMPSVFQNDNGFLTMHERIGRVGSQRLTLYNGLWDVFAPHGLLPGGGISIQKVPLGVTVRHMEFIDDASISSTSRPVYVMLVSHEIEGDQSYLNDDGLTPEERQQIKEEKEAARVRKQVEADLGGFDMEQEWVEEIEREDCFAVDSELGLAPSMPIRKYEVWLVDASSQWKVLDKYELDEFEHGTALKVMFLTDVVEDSDEVPEKSLVIGVGTSVIDHDGEDLASKGRVLLFQVKKSKKRAPSKGSKDPPLEMTLKSEKEIALGPVTNLASLKSDDIYRVVVGAGAEVTVEQWGSGKLTQVGFYHAHMQVQEIVLFKTFFLLSDAYDSLHFLVWRESDKSLTLLAKDYEPTQVFATGLISRGGAMAFVCHDDRQNVSFLQYSPTDAAARGGNKLVCRADFHMGTQTTSLKSHWGQSSLLFNSCTMTSTLAALKQQDTLFGRLEDDQRFAVNFGTTDGSFCSIVPLSEPTYWRLTALQSVMSNALESNCALSHRAWRLYRRSTRRAGCRSNDRKKGVIDGDLVMKFADLPLPEQEDLASSIGSTVGLVMDNLLELGCAASVI